jgi:dihydrofolate reductase
MVIGGAQIYRDCLPIADKLYLTQVEAEVEGDAFFPNIDLNQWQKVAETIPKTMDSYNYRFVVLQRVQKQS